MSADASAYKINLTFGKYKGFSLGYVHDTNPSYLRWLTTAESLPSYWINLATQVLEKKDITSLIPTTKIAGKSSVSAPSKASVSILNKTTLKVNFEYNPEMLARFKFEIDGRKWNNEEKHWEIPSVQILKLVDLFGGTSNLTVDDATKKVWQEETSRKNDLNSIRSKEDSEKIAETLSHKLKMPLFNYQNVAVEFVDRAGGRAMIADDIGLGKTITSIAFAMMKGYKTLIVCPKSVVPHWMNEVKKFTDKLAVQWVSEGRLGRSDAMFQIINYDIVKNHFEELNKMKFDLLICDEATLLKNRNTLRAKSLLGSYKERKKYPGVKVPYCIFLTGTPVLNRPIEAFHLLSYLDKERFNNFYHFVERYGGWQGLEAHNLDDLHERTKDLIIRRLKKEVKNELPDKQRNDLYIEMTPSDLKEYDTHLATLFRKWRQLGKPTVAEMPAIQKFLITKKMPRAIEMIDELLEAGRGIMIFSVYIDPLIFLKKHYGNTAAMLYGQMNSKDRQKSIDDLSSGKAKVGLFSLGAGSMGIDGIQKQIDTVLFLDQWWVPAIHEQAEGRCHRTGQNNKVQVYYLICENTIDEMMREILTEKQKIIDMVIDGKLISIARDKSFFKEFVQKLAMKKRLDKKINVSDIEDDLEYKIDS